MRDFTELILTLERLTHDAGRTAAVAEYFRRAPPADTVWALRLLAGPKLRPAVKVHLLRSWAAQAAGLPLWLVEECIGAVGDISEALALLVPSSGPPTLMPLGQLIHERWRPMADAPPQEQERMVRGTWSQLDCSQRRLWNLILLGRFPFRPTQPIVVDALSTLAGVEPSVMQYRLLGPWEPTPHDLARLLSGDLPGDEIARPYPFHLPTSLPAGPESLGRPGDWQIEWKWDGIRAQLIRRSGKSLLWSCDREVISKSHPAVVEAASALPDGTVLDGHLVAGETGALLSGNASNPPVRDSHSIVFIAGDLLEYGGQDQRDLPLTRRRAALARLLSTCQTGPAHRGSAATVQGDLFALEAPAAPSNSILLLSPAITPASWGDLAIVRREARKHHARGVVLKPPDSRHGRQQPADAWWNWDTDPLTCLAVLMAVGLEPAPRAGRLAEFTFALWNGTELVSITRTKPTLAPGDDEAIHAFIRTHTTARFGPVRSVQPTLVFELAFDGVVASTRHKSGILLQSPRLLRWCRDTPISQAATLDQLRALAT